MGAAVARRPGALTMQKSLSGPSGKPRIGIPAPVLGADIDGGLAGQAGRAERCRGTRLHIEMKRRRCGEAAESPRTFAPTGRRSGRTSERFLSRKSLHRPGRRFVEQSPCESRRMAFTTTRPQPPSTSPEASATPRRPVPSTAHPRHVRTVSEPRALAFGQSCKSPGDRGACRRPRATRLPARHAPPASFSPVR